MSTIFSKILEGEIPAEFIYEDEHLVVIKDAYPKASVHVLMIPRKPIINLDDLNHDDERLMGYMMMKIPQIAAKRRLPYDNQYGKRGWSGSFPPSYTYFGWW